MKQLNTLVSILLSALLFTTPCMGNEVQNLSEEDAFKFGSDAYIYGYPLVTMEFTRQAMTNVSAPKEKSAPMGQFANMASFPTAAFKDVTAPNADTLYSSAWLDLSKEPYILHVPEEEGRYYLLEMLSGWTNVFASPGTRATGTLARDFVIVGPNWKGELPPGVTKLTSPTDMVWIIGRTYSNGTPKDLSAVQAIQKQYALTPLSAWGKPYTPPKNVAVNSKLDTKTPPRDQVNKMNAATYFKQLALLLKANPPAAEDKAMVETLNRLGIKPGEAFDINTLPEPVKKGLERSVIAGLKQITDNIPNIGKKVNGWQISDKLGSYGNDYLLRASTAFAGLGANLAIDALYPMVSVDSTGQPLDGNNSYVIHFSKEEIPPVKGFWSLTLYNDKFFFVANPLNRYNLSSRDIFKVNADGSLDLYIQHQTPEIEKKSNWLPAPNGPFNLILRLYWPKDSVLKGTWTPPAVVLVPNDTNTNQNKDAMDNDTQDQYRVRIRHRNDDYNDGYNNQGQTDDD